MCWQIGSIPIILILADDDREQRTSRFTYWGIVFWEICRSVNEHIWMLPCHSNHLLRPREADMPADDLQIGKFQRNLVDILLVLDDFLVHEGRKWKLCLPERAVQPRLGREDRCVRPVLTKRQDKPVSFQIILQCCPWMQSKID